MKKIFFTTSFVLTTIICIAQSKSFTLGGAKLETIIKSGWNKTKMETFIKAYKFEFSDTTVRQNGIIINFKDIDTLSKYVEFEYTYKVEFNGDIITLAALVKDKPDNSIYQLDLTINNDLDSYNMLSECVKNGYRIKKQIAGYWIYGKGNYDAIVSYGRKYRVLTILKHTK